MKKIICFLFTITLFSTDSYTQERDSLIQLYPGMGDTLDCIDREIFGLYPDIDGFKYAQIFVRDRKFLISIISHLNNGTLKDTLLVEDYYQLYFLRLSLSKFISDNDIRFDTPPEVSIFTNAGNNYNGKLDMFSKTFLFLNSDTDHLSSNYSPIDFLIPVTIVDSMKIQGLKPNLGPYIGNGALGGAGLGLGIGLVWINTENFWEGYGIYVVGITTVLGAGVGALIGWLIGETTPRDFITIRFNSPNDITKLKDYSSYYFQYDKTLEEKYVEVP